MVAYEPANSFETPRFSGVRTFMRLPNVQDLQNSDVAIAGAPFDTGASFRVGARFGPEGIRSASHLLRPTTLPKTSRSSSTSRWWTTGISL